VETEEDLVATILAACASIQNIPSDAVKRRVPATPAKEPMVAISKSHCSVFKNYTIKGTQM
jgi:hypothetical protein